MLGARRRNHRLACVLALAGVAIPLLSRSGEGPTVAVQPSAIAPNAVDFSHPAWDVKGKAQQAVSAGDTIITLRDDHFVGQLLHIAPNPLTAYRASTGEVLRSKPLPDGLSEKFAPIDVELVPDLAYPHTPTASDVVLLSVSDGSQGLSDISQFTNSLYALDPADGTVRWKRELANGDPSMAQYGSTVLVCDNQKVSAIEIATNKERWAKPSVSSQGTIWSVNAANQHYVAALGGPAPPEQDLGSSAAPSLLYLNDLSNGNEVAQRSIAVAPASWASPTTTL